LHLGVPATGLVPEVDAALEELAHGDDGHGSSFPVRVLRTSGEQGAGVPLPLSASRLSVVDRVVATPGAHDCRHPPGRDRAGCLASLGPRDCERDMWARDVSQIAPAAVQLYRTPPRLPAVQGRERRRVTRTPPPRRRALTCYPPPSSPSADVLLVHRP